VEDQMWHEVAWSNVLVKSSWYRKWKFLSSSHWIKQIFQVSRSENAVRISGHHRAYRGHWSLQCIPVE
jgi:hypothetical protein